MFCSILFVCLSARPSVRAKRRWLSPSAPPAPQSAAASPAPKRAQARPSVPPEPAQCYKCHACHAKRRWVSPSATPFSGQALWPPASTKLASKAMTCGPRISSTFFETHRFDEGGPWACHTLWPLWLCVAGQTLQAWICLGISGRGRRPASAYFLATRPKPSLLVAFSCSSICCLLCFFSFFQFFAQGRGRNSSRTTPPRHSRGVSRGVPASFFHFFFFCFQPLPQDGVMNTAEVRGWLCKRNLPQEMGHPRWERWELAGRETGRGIYHMTWDFQDGNYQVGKREEEFTTGDGTSLMGTGR